MHSHSDELGLEIFQEAEVESGLLEAIVLSLVLLRSGRSLGDTLGTLSINYCVGVLPAMPFLPSAPPPGTALE